MAGKNVERLWLFSMKISQHIYTTWKTHEKVGENYIFMTALQIINMCFYLLIYPLLIRRLGADSYGLYAFAWSVAVIVAAIVGFGFDLLGTKHVSEIVASTSGKEQQESLSRVLSVITQARIILLVGVSVVYAIVVYTIPFLVNNRLIFCIAFFQAGVIILFPQWYFQGVQRMRVVTYIQLLVKTASLFPIYWFIHTADDVWKFMLITVASGWIGGCISAWIILWKDGLRLVKVGYSVVRQYYHEAFPLFLTNIMGIIKEQGVVMLVGGFLGMREVAVYDLANKIVTVPRIMLLQINNALFPKIVVERNTRSIRKIMLGEVIVSLSVTLVIAAIGKWCVALLGGWNMIDAWPVSILLSATILCWMIGTAYIDFVFIPTNNNHLVAWNQLVALFSFILVGSIGISFVSSVYVVVGALVISGISELIFCYSITHHNRLMQQL